MASLRAASRLSLRFAQTNAWIERRIKDVDEQIDDDEHEHGDQQIRDDDRPVEQVDRVDEKLAHAGPGEHSLGNDGEGDDRAEFEADSGSYRGQYFGQPVVSAARG